MELGHPSPYVYLRALMPDGNSSTLPLDVYERGEGTSDLGQIHRSGPDVLGLHIPLHKCVANSVARHGNQKPSRP